MIRQPGAWLIIAAAALWGTTGTAQALAPAEAQPLAIGALRLAVAGLALLANLIARGTALPARGLPVGKVLLASACMAAYQILFFAGIKATGVAVGTVVGIGSAPVITGLLAFLFLGERPGWRWFAATGMAVLGCGLLIGARKEMTVDPVGLLLAVGAGAAYATFSLACKDLLRRQPVEVVMAVVFGLGALVLVPLLFSQNLAWAAQPRGIAVLLWLGLMATALAYLLFGAGLRRTALSTAVTLSLAEPLTAGLLGIFFLGERLVTAGWIGLGLMLAGLLVLKD
jgi:DME family drug/metabolite transporter